MSGCKVVEGKGEHLSHPSPPESLKDDEAFSQLPQSSSFPESIEEKN
jgi:hypothetical protein